MKIRNLVKHFQRKQVHLNEQPLPAFKSILPDQLPGEEAMSSRPVDAQTPLIWPDSSFTRFLRMLDALRELELPEPLVFHAAFACMKVGGVDMDALLRDGTAFINSLKQQQDGFQLQWEQAWVQYVAVKEKYTDDLIKESQQLKESLLQNESRIRKLAADKRQLEEEMEHQHQAYFEKSNSCIALLQQYLNRTQYYLPNHAKSA